MPSYKPPPPVPHRLLMATPLPDASSDLSLLAQAIDSCHVTPRDSSRTPAVGTEQALVGLFTRESACEFQTGVRGRTCACLLLLVERGGKYEQRCEMKGNEPFRKNTPGTLF